MNMKSVISEIGTNLKVTDQQTGMPCSECGYVGLSNLTEEQQKAMRRIPRLFLPLLNDCMLARIYELFHGSSKNFNPRVPIDKDIVKVLPVLRHEVRSATYTDIAEYIARICSVLQCNLPDETGLEEYFKILKEFPKLMLEECCESIIQTTSYRKLPLPVDFIRHMEVSRTVHMTWLDRLENKYINYKE